MPLNTSQTVQGVSTEHSVWLVDLDGTLYHSSPVKLMMGIELLTAGRRVWSIVRQFRKAHEELRLLPVVNGDHPQSPYERQLQVAADRSGEDVATVRSVINEWMFERPGKWLRLFRRRSLLNRISRHRQAGGRTALVSDYPAAKKLTAMGVQDLFDCVIANGESAPSVELKPAPDGFLLAAEQLNASASECLVMGDRTDADGAAALSAGMTFCLVRQDW